MRILEKLIGSRLRQARRATGALPSVWQWNREVPFATYEADAANYILRPAFPWAALADFAGKGNQVPNRQGNCPLFC